jgi:hypothetical protein
MGFKPLGMAWFCDCPSTELRAVSPSNREAAGTGK